MIFDLISPLPLRECVRRLRAETDRGWAIAGTKPVLGTVGDASIRLRQRTYYRHSSPCWLAGELVEEDGKTRLHCRIGLHPFFRRFLEFWVAGVFIVGGVFFERALRSIWEITDAGPWPPELWLGLVAPPLLLGCGVVLLIFGDQISSEEPRFLVEFLERVIEAREA